jgi:hypothetical protein
MNKTLLFLLVLSTALYTSCKKKDVVSHNLAFEQNFDTLIFNDPFEVELIQDSSDKIEIIGYEPFVSNIETSYKNNTMTVSKRPAMAWLFPNKNKILLKIHVSHISRIVANETCYIRSVSPLIGNELGLILKSKLNQADLNVQCTTFYFWNNFPCGGTLNLTGSCQELKLWNYALMQVDATALLANIPRVENDSKGDMHLRCLESIFFKISGEGNIKVYGNPSNVYDLGCTGSGKLSLH